MALPFPNERRERPRALTGSRLVSWRRLLIAGLVAAGLAAVAGLAIERSWLGATDAAAAARVEATVRRDFDGMIAALSQVAVGIATNPSARELAPGPEAARALFDLVANARAGTPRPDDIAVTVYDAVRGDARAWSGRPTSDIPPDRIVGPQDLFVTHSVLGLRLVQIVPILGMEGGKGGRRVGTVAVEHVLSRATAGAAIAPVEDSLQTSIAPVSFRTRFEGAGRQPAAGCVSPAHPGRRAARRGGRRRRRTCSGRARSGAEP